MRSAQRETLPGLFDQGSPQPQPGPITPVGQEIDRLNAAAERVLLRLKRGDWVSNVELCQPEIGGNRAIGRVFELREHGWQIEKRHVQGGRWEYRLTGQRQWA